MRHLAATLLAEASSAHANSYTPTGALAATLLAEASSAHANSYTRPSHDFLSVRGS